MLVLLLPEAAKQISLPAHLLVGTSGSTNNLRAECILCSKQ
jgi:hypothetical protein